MISHAYVSPAFSRRERRRAMRALMGGPRLPVPNDRAARWPLYAVLACAVVAAIAGLS